MRAYDEVLSDDLCRLLLASREDQVADLLQAAERAGAVVVVGASAPEGLVVMLDLLAGRASVYHRSHVGIAQREGLEPSLRRSVVPKDNLGTDGRGENGQKKDQG